MKDATKRARKWSPQMTRNWLIIGSVAKKHWFPDSRTPKDIDLLTPAKISGNHSSTCVVDAVWHDEAQWLIDINVDQVFLDADLLYTLKVSHAQWDIHWEKTMSDIMFLKHKGCRLDKVAHARLVPLWEKIHGAKLVNLNKPNDEFFVDAVGRKYDHDLIHRLVAFNESPMHERIRPKSDSAWCDVNLFEALSADEKAQTALEEIMAVAIERGRLTSNSLLSDKLRFINRAYFLLCTSMTKGWFALYLIENSFNLLVTRRKQWMTKLNTALSNLPR